MARTDLEHELQAAFERVKQRTGYIPLRHVQLASALVKNKQQTSVDTACITMDDFRLYINPSFVETLAQKLPVADAIEGILDHEVGHYLYHPFSLKRLITEDITLHDKPHALTARHYYDDVNDNLRVIARHNEQTRIPDLYHALTPGSKAEEVLCTLYERLTGREFGAPKKMSKPQDKAVQSLLEINFLNYNHSTKTIEFVKKDESQNREDILEFYTIMEPLFSQDQKSNDGKHGKGNQQMGSSPQIGDYPDGEIRKALKELLQEGTITPEEAKTFIEKNKELLDQNNIPGGSRNDNPETFADRIIYESLASKYKINVEKHPLTHDGGMHPSHHTKYQTGDRMEDIDIFNSPGGLIIPGYTNRWVKTNMRTYGAKKQHPDLILILDDSGSMKSHIRDGINNAQLGGVVLSKEYIRNGSPVGLILFSDRTETFQPTKNLSMVVNNILRFKDGNDTVLELEKVDELSELIRGPRDYVIITDAAIKNQDAIVTYLNTRATTGDRAYLLHIGGTPGAHYNDLVKTIGIQAQDDIGTILLNNVRHQP